MLWVLGLEVVLGLVLWARPGCLWGGDILLELSLLVQLRIRSLPDRRIIDRCRTIEHHIISEYRRSLLPNIIPPLGFPFLLNPVFTPSFLFFLVPCLLLLKAHILKPFLFVVPPRLWRRYRMVRLWYTQRFRHFLVGGWVDLCPDYLVSIGQCVD